MQNIDEPGNRVQVYLQNVLRVSGLVLSCVLANDPMESNGQGWGAWSTLVQMC